MAIHNKSHFNHALQTLNQMRRDNIKGKSSIDFDIPQKTDILLHIGDCLDFLKTIPDNSIQLICIDPPYNLELENWDIYDDYIEWADKWLQEAYRVLSPNGNMAIFGGIQFRNVKSGDLIEIIHHLRYHSKFQLINTIIWHYKNGMSAHRYFANRHEEIIWLAKTKNYYFDLDSVREKYSEKELALALKDKRLNPENTKKGKNPTNVWDIRRLNGNSRERVGHPTQKPVEIIRRIVKSMSYPDSIVLDFFCGSGTVGRVCIEEKRNCIMCDSDKKSKDFFAKQIANMRDLGCKNEYTMNDTLEDFTREVEKHSNEDEEYSEA